MSGKHRLPFPLPSLQEDLCLRSGPGWSRCDICQSACPVEGFSMEPLPSIPDACISCHFCVARCPEGAWEGQLPTLTPEGYPYKAYRCSMVMVEGVPAIPCMGAIPRFFIGLIKESQKKVTFFTGDCSACPLLQGKEAFSPLVQLEQAQDWIWMETSPNALPNGRRQFFDLISRSLYPKATSLRDYPGYKASRQGKVSPQFLDGCIACTLCEVVCPERVFSRKPQEDGVEIRISPAFCTGCRKCVDSCRFSGITLEPTKGKEVPRVYFFPTRKCARCGMQFEGQRDLCPRCRGNSIAKEKEHNPIRRIFP